MRAVSGWRPVKLFDHFITAHKGSEATAQALLNAGLIVRGDITAPR
jgi:hypothetical protein